MCVSRVRDVFSKGYETQFTDEVFQIDSVITNRAPVAMYKLVDYEKSAIHGSFYTQELQRIVKPEIFRVEKVLRTRKVDDHVERLVKWIGYKQPTWTSSDIVLKK